METLKIMPIPHLDKAEGDILLEASAHIEKLDQDTVMESLQSIAKVRGFTAFCIGGVLNRIHQNQWYLGMGYTAFGTFVGDCVGISSSTAYDYMKIYQGLSESGIAWENVEQVGWTKVRLFAQYLTANNVDEWIEAAQDRNATQLREYVKLVVTGKQKLLSTSNPLLSTHVDSGAEAQDPNPVILDPANDMGANDGVTQSNLAMDAAPENNSDHSGDDNPKGKGDLVTNEAASTSLIKSSFWLYPNQFEMVQTALEKAKQEGHTKSKSAALEYICMSYLA